MINLQGIKNIIFDLGGVLLNLDFNLTQQAFIALGITDFELYHTKAKQNGLFNRLETGKITTPEFCNQLRALTGIAASNQEIITAWNAMLLNFPIERKQLILALKKNYTISLLSNTNEIHLHEFYKIIENDIGEQSLNNMFHSHYFSNEIGYRKPNKKAFELVLEQNNFIASETLFIDDTKEHVEAAKQLGIQTHFLNLEENQTLLNLFDEY